ncbi:MAG: MerR family transcriptional regulator [Chitinophagales bacterium]
MPYKEKEIEKLYFTIGEVAQDLGLNASQIRYWETEFSELKPRKDRKGNRIFTKEDIEMIRLIHYLTKDRGFTIEGAKTQLKAEGARLSRHLEIRDALQRIRGFLQEMKNSLDN